MNQLTVVIMKDHGALEGFTLRSVEQGYCIRATCNDSVKGPEFSLRSWMAPYLPFSSI
jgi:hypothetical protein